jgi:hypothetical protein
MSNPDLDLANQIVARTTGHAVGTDIFCGKMREEGAGIPTQSVWCLLRGGMEPIDYCDNSPTPQLRQPIVQILVRGNPGDFSGGQALARTVKDAVHDHPPAGYFGCRVQQAEPIYLGEEHNGAHLWSLNVMMYIEE